LTRFGYSYLEELFKELGVQIQVLDDKTRDKIIHDELLQDFMSLLASFRGKFYKIRSLEHKKKLLHTVEEKLENEE
jgi:putative resolvase